MSGRIWKILFLLLAAGAGIRYCNLYREEQKIDLSQIPDRTSAEVGKEELMAFLPVWSDYEKREFLFDGAPFDEEFGHRIYGLSYDVSALLVPGQNTLLVHVTPGWYAQPTWVGGDQSAAYGRPRLCFALEYEDENGAHTLLSASGLKELSLSSMAATMAGERLYLAAFSSISSS